MKACDYLNLAKACFETNRSHDIEFLDKLFIEAAKKGDFNITLDFNNQKHLKCTFQQLQNILSELGFSCKVETVEQHDYRGESYNEEVLRVSWENCK